MIDFLITYGPPALLGAYIAARHPKVWNALGIACCIYWALTLIFWFTGVTA